MAFSFQYIKDYYQMPFLERGLRVNMDGRWATVTSGDGSYVRARFDGRSFSSRIHPTWETTYYNSEGKVLANYKDGKEPPAFVPCPQKPQKREEATT